MGLSKRVLNRARTVVWRCRSWCRQFRYEEPRHPSQFRLEPLEPRLLLSADFIDRFGALALPDFVAPGDGASVSAIVTNQEEAPAAASLRINRQADRDISEASQTINAVASISWAIDSDGFWDVASNWSTGVVPTVADDVTISQPGVITITVQSGTQSVRSLQSQESLQITGGSLAVAQASQVDGDFSLSGGSLVANGTFTITGNSTWTGGTISGSASLTNAGTFNVAGTGAKILGADTTLNNAGQIFKSTGADTSTITGGTFNNTGTVEVIAGTLSIGSTIAQISGTTLTGGTWNVLAGAKLDLAAAPNLTTNSANVTLSGAGSTFAKINSLASNTGTFSFMEGRDFTRSGALANSGTVILGDGSDLLGAFTIITNTGRIRKSAGAGDSLVESLANQGGTIEVLSGRLVLTSNSGTSTGGTFAVAAGAVLDLTGGFSRTYGGTYTGSGAGRIEMASGTLTTSGTGATFNFPGELFHWTGGTIANHSSRPFTNLGEITLSGQATKFAAGLQFDNAGTMIHTGTGNLEMGFFGSTINNLAGAVYEFRSDADIAGSGAFNNSGTMTKSAGTGAASEVNLPINTTATAVFDVQAGRLKLNGGGLWLGATLNAAAGAVLEVSAGALVTGEFTGSGAGRVELSGGSIASVDHFVAGAHATFNFPDDLLHWTGGTIGGGGCGGFGGCSTTLVNAGALTIDGPAGKGIGGSGLINTGTIINLGPGDFGQGGNTFDNRAGATYEHRGDSVFSITDQFGNPGRFINAGTFRKTAGTGTVDLTARLENASTGVIEVQSGRLKFSRGGNSTGGTFNVSTGAMLDLTGGSAFPTYGGTYTGSGGGRIELAAGTLNTSGTGATFNFPEGMFHWTGGSIIASSIRPFINAGSMTLSGAGTKFLASSTLNNTGRIIHAEGVLAFDSGILNNDAGAVYELQGDFRLADGPTFFGGGGFTNSGTVLKSAGAGEARIENAFNNSLGGTIEVQSATLNLAGSFGVMSGGTFIVSPGAVLETSGIIRISGTFTGSGGGVLRHTGRLENIGNQTSTFNFPPGFFQWTAGQINYYGTGTLINEGTITLAGSADKFSRLDAGLTNRGTIIHTGDGNLQTWVTSRFVNEGVYELQSDSDIVIVGVPFTPPFLTFTNSGTFRKSDGLGTSQILSDPSSFGTYRFSNTGTVEVLSGTLSFPEPVSQVSGSTLTGGAWMVSEFSALDIVSGANITTNEGDVTLSGPASNFNKINTLASNKGSFTLRDGRDFSTTGSFANTGQLTLGPGSTLTVNGNFTEAGDQTLNIEIGGRPATGLFGQVSVTGQANLQGRLNIALTEGFGPTLGDSYQIMSFASHVGNFSEITGLEPFFEAVVGGSKVVLNTMAAAADFAVEKITVPASGTPGEDVTISYTVRNFTDTEVPGSWIDSLYLSKDAIFDPDDQLIGRFEHTGGVQALSTYTETLTAPLPGVIDGDYHVIVIADSRGIIADTDRSNNTLASAELIAVGIPLLAFDTTTMGTVEEGQDIYFRLDVQAGGDVVLTANFETQLEAELFVRYRELPDRSNFDFTASNLLELHRTITLASPQAGAYYILLHGREGAADGKAFDLTAKHISLALQTVTPNRGSNVGEVTSTLKGTGFSPKTVVNLMDQQGGVADRAEVIFANANTLFATFDLTGLAGGLYNFRVTDNSSTAMIAGGFQVTTGAPGQLEVSISSPSRIRAGRPAKAQIDYRNVGATDLVAPLLLVFADNAFLKLTTQPSFVRNRVMLLGINPDGQAGVLPPGAAGRVVLDFLPSGSTMFSVSSLDGETASVDLTLLKDETRPFGMPQQAWDVVFANFLADAGNSWGQFRQTLATYATHLSQFGGATPDVAQLIGFGLTRADNFGEITRRLTPGAFGMGWPDGGDIRVITDSAGNPSILLAGKVQSFIRQSNGTFLPARIGDTGQLTFDQDHFELLNSDGIMLSFRPDNKLDFVQDLNGNRVTMGYTSDLLTTITDSFGAVITYSYDSQGHITRITDPVGRTHDYTYDAAGTHLMSVTDATGTLTYSYVAGQGTAREGALESINSPNGALSTFEYDDRGRVMQATRFGEDGETNYAYDAAGTVIAKDPTGRETRGLFNELGDVARLFEPGGITATATPDPEDSAINLIDVGGSRWTTQYDDLGNATLLRGPLGHTIEASYNPAFNSIERFRDQRGNTTGYDYDQNGNLTAINHPDGSSFRFEYDSVGRTTRQINRRGGAIAFTYNSDNLLTRKEFPDGSRIDFTYDSHFNLTSATRMAGNIEETTTATYNVEDQITSFTDAVGRTLSFAYDASGRRTSLIGPDGLNLNYFYDNAGRLSWIADGADSTVVAYTYDAVGRVIRVGKGSGPFTEYAYDELDQVVSIVNRAADSSVISRFDYTYDDRGLIASLSTLDGVTQYQYDALGQLTSLLLPGGRTIAYEYDATGNRIRQVDSGVTTNYATNNLNQVLSSGATTYTYDADGNLVLRTDAGGTTSYEYDVENRIIRVTSPLDTWEFGYDAMGNRFAVIHNGVQIDYLFDFGGAPVAEYGANGLVANYFSGLGLVGRRDSMGVLQFFNFDSSGNVTELSDAMGEVLNSYRYLPFGEKLLSIENISNPFTFVGQFAVMDARDGMYWMRNRHYLPELGRFMSPDPLGFEGGDANLYRYAANNPISQIDPSGLAHIPHISPNGLRQELRVIHELEQTIAATGPWVETVRRAGSLADTIHERMAKFGLESVERQIQRLERLFEYDISPEVAERIRKATAGAKKFLEKGRPVLEKIREGEAAVARLAAREAAKKATEEAAEQAAKTGARRLGARSLLGRLLTNPYLAAAMIGWDIGTAARAIPGVDETATEFANWVMYGTTHPTDPYGNFGPRAFQLFSRGWRPHGSSGSSVVTSFDPNDIIGPRGFGPDGFLLSDQTLPYTIHFENLASANAPAQEVLVTQQLDSDLDFNSFELGDFGFGDVEVDVPEGRNFFTTRVDVRDTLGIFVDIEAGIHLNTGVATWRFTSIDPETGDFPSDALVGFLPPNVTSPEGEGFVTYSIRPKGHLTTGTRIDARATIDFDPFDPTNPPLDTPLIFNTIDAGVPTSNVSVLPPITTNDRFTVSWSGQDDGDGTPGSGIAFFDVFVSRDGAPFEPFLPGTTETSAIFEGEDGRTYSFYVVATDNVGHQEEVPLAADATTTVDLFEVVIGTNANKAVIYRDADGTDVTVTMKGSTATVRFRGENLQEEIGKKGVTVAGENIEIVQVALADTTDKSSLTFKTKGGDGFAGVHRITGVKPMGKLLAKTINLIGQGIAMTGEGFIAMVQLHDVLNGADIMMPGAGNAKGSTITAGQIGAGTGIELNSGLKGLTATEWLDGSLTAPWAAKIAIKGDMGVDLALAGDPNNVKLALGSATISGNLFDAFWAIGGSVGKVTVGAMRKSKIFAGVKDGVEGLPGLLTHFGLLVEIGSVTVKGIPGSDDPSFVDSLIAASSLKKVSLKGVEKDNGGRPFGIAADRIKSYTRSGIRPLSNLDLPGEPDKADDYVVRLL